MYNKRMKIVSEREVLVDIEKKRKERYARRERFIELSVFVFLFLPSIVLSFFFPLEKNIDPFLTALATVSREISLTALVLFFLWRNREPKHEIGLTGRTLGDEILIGVILFAPFAAALNLVTAILRSAGFSAPGVAVEQVRLDNAPALVLAAVFIFLIALCEEVIFRGYLLNRLRQLSGSFWVGASLSSLMFALGHGYQGSAAVIAIGMAGFVLAAIAGWRQSLTAPIVMHFLLNLFSIVFSSSR